MQVKQRMAVIAKPPAEPMSTAPDRGACGSWALTGFVMLLGCLLQTAAFAQSAESAATAEVAAAEPEPTQQATAEDAGTDDSANADTSTEDADAEQASFEERLDKLLVQGETEEVYGETENCLYHRKYRNIDIINENMLLFSRGDQYWLNTLKRNCLGLRRSMVINVLMKGIGSICANDQVYANTRFDMNQGWTASGRPVLVRATCTLGEFRSIDETFARALLALKE